MLRAAGNLVAQLHLVPESCCLAVFKVGYATSVKPEVKQTTREIKRIPVSVRRLLRTVQDLPDEEITIFVRNGGQMFSYNNAMRDKRPNADQVARIKKEQIKKAIENATSIEDFYYTPPADLKPFPPLSRLPGIYSGISKFRLTMLVVLTAMGGYAMAPGAFNLATLTYLTVGTTLQSAAANATNQVIEVKYDAQMKRTRNRPLVQGLISRQHGAAFALVSGVAGTGMLYLGVNPITCYLGTATYLIYTSLYTPMKRLSATNTWVGSVVGGLPPVMGWTAATGTIDMGALWLGTILYIWQFPHFKALSWNVKGDYQRAGYQMSSVTDPEMCKRVAFRHTIFMTIACALGPAVGTTTNMFVLYSLPCNLYGVYLGWKFYHDGDSRSSRNLFRFSLVSIPYLLIMMLVSKNWDQQ